jgi:sugar phosphate isomerase/epimerase
VEILEMGHLNSVGICLDLGHANITTGVTAAIATLNTRIRSVHVHDNKGVKDEHLFPGDGTIDWAAAVKALKHLPEPPAIVLEVHQSFASDPKIQARIEQAFSLFD